MHFGSSFRRWTVQSIARQRGINSPIAHLREDLLCVEEDGVRNKAGIRIVSQMAGIFFIDGIKRSLRRRAREKKLAAAKNWPTAQGQGNHLQGLNAEWSGGATGAAF